MLSRCPILIWRRVARLLPGFVAAVFIAIFWSGAAQASGNQANSPAQRPLSISQLQKDTLIVGSEQDYPPFATGMTDATAGGFTVDLWKAVAAEAGLGYRIHVGPFREVLQQFKDGKIDVLINLAQSEERHHFADFTVPHVVVHGAIFVRKGESGVQTEADLADKSIIVLNADLAHDYAVSKGWERQLVLVDTAADGLRLLASGKHDAMLLSKLAGMQTLQALGLSNIEALKAKAGFSQKFAFAVAEGQSQLLGKINEGLALTKSNGKYDALYEKWFGLYEVKEIGLRDLLKYLIPIVTIFLCIAGYFFYRRQIERAEAERKYRDLYDHAPDMFLSVAAKTATVVDCNQTLLSNTGYLRGEVVGHSVLELYHPDCADAASAAFRQFLETKELHGVELQLRRKDGSKIEVSLNASAVCDDQGHILHSRSVLRDITERKRAEEARRESEQLFDSIVENIPNMIFLKRASDLRFKLFNRAGERLLGHSREELLDRNDYDFFPKEQADFFTAKDRATLERDDIVDIPEEHIDTPSGTRILHTRKLTLRDKYGQPQYLLGISEDITERIEAESRLHTLSTAVEQSPISIVITGVDANIEYVNPRFVEVTGYTPEEALGQNPRILQSGLTPPSTFHKLWTTLDSGRVWHGELANKRKNGEIYWEEAHIAPVKNEAGELTHYVAAKVDITQRKRNEEALRQSELRFRFILENSPIAVRIAKMDTDQVVFANQRYAELIGVSRDQVIGIDPKQYYANPQDYADVLEQLGKGGRVTNKLIELVIPSEHSETKWVLASYLRLEFQNEQAVLGWFYDISDRKAMEERVQHLAHYDPLTDLPNRTLLADRLQQALAVAKRDKNHLALMFIDLDEFKPINDTLGHDVGDLMLKEVAQRIQACLRESDTVARVGGDEFIVLLPTMESEQDALGVAEKIRCALKERFELAGHRLGISSSMGIAIYPEHGCDESQLVKNADTAMYYAKAAGRDNVKIYQSNMQEMSA